MEGRVCFHRNSDRLGNGVLYASVNPEYFSAAESEYRVQAPLLLCVRVCVADVVSRSAVSMFVWI